MKAPKNKLNSRIVSFIELTLPGQEETAVKQLDHKINMPVEKK